MPQTSPVYPGHETLWDDPLNQTIQLHAPGFYGTNAQRVAFNTTGLTVSKLWFETDTKICYQWTGTAWQTIAVSGGAVTNVLGSGLIVSSGGSTPTISLSAITSEVLLTGGNGEGATNTVIRRFTTVSKNNGGADISITQDATNGDSFTINTTGTYAISYVDSDGTGGVAFGLSVNSNQLTTSIDSITASNVLSVAMLNSAGQRSFCGVTYRATAGDVIRAHGSSASRPNGTIAQNVILRIIKIGT